MCLWGCIGTQTCWRALWESNRVGMWMRWCADMLTGEYGIDSVTLGLGHSASKPKGFVRSLHGLSSMCFYALNRYAASTTTRLL